MFDEKDVKFYKEISAPDTLKEKVMSVQTKKTHFSYRGAYAVVACVILLLSLSAVWDWNHSTAEVHVIQQQAALNAREMRGFSESSVLLEVSANRRKRLTVSSGNLKCVDAVTGEELAYGSDLWADKDTVISWEADGNTKKGCNLYVGGWGRDQMFQIIFDQETETWTIKK